MEISIRIMVTMVVILAVGFLVIKVSSDLLTTSADNVEKLSEVDSKNLIIEKNNFTDSEIKFLAKDCYTKYTGIEENKLCHILNAENPIDVNSISAVYINSSSGYSKTIYIKYMLAGDGVVIYE